MNRFAYAATKNAGKLRELTAIFARLGWSLQTFDGYADVDEGEDSYADNAARKARALWEQLARMGRNADVLGDDSGLEVRALGGRPGVLSARYGGPGASWSQRRQMLLAELGPATVDRSAAFVCALHYIDAAGAESATIERVEGYLALRERGDAGFSYDSIFIYPPLAATFAEVSEGQKNAISHRARAAEALTGALLGKGSVRGNDQG